MDIDKRELHKLTLDNHIYTKDGKSKIYKMEIIDGDYFINDIPIKDILFFDISWVYGREFELYGFKKNKKGDHEKGDILIIHHIFDHMHVHHKNGEDFGRFYTAQALEDIVKDHFNEVLKIQR